MPYHGSTGGMCVSHPVDSAFNVALIRNMFKLADTWVISDRVTVPLFTVLLCKLITCVTFVFLVLKTEQTTELSNIHF